MEEVIMEEAIATPIYEIEVLGEPMGKQRPRASSWGGHAHIYTPAKTVSYERRFASAYMDKYGEAKPTSLPIAVTIEAVFGLKKADYNSKGCPNKHGNAKLMGIEQATKKPDADNIAKAVLDGLNGVAFVDDSQVVRLTIYKKYGLTPKVKASWKEI